MKRIILAVVAMFVMAVPAFAAGSATVQETMGSIISGCNLKDRSETLKTQWNNLNADASVDAVKKAIVSLEKGDGISAHSNLYNAEKYAKQAGIKLPENFCELWKAVQMQKALNLLAKDIEGKHESYSFDEFDQAVKLMVAANPAPKSEKK